MAKEKSNKERENIHNGSDTQSSPSKKKKRKRTAGDIIRLIIMLIALGVFIFSASQLAMIFLEYKAGEDEYKGLRKYVTVNEDNDETDKTAEDTSETPEVDAGFSDIDIDFDGLQALNPDIIGWIIVDGVEEINYPIVQGEDNDRYLHYTFEGKANSSGSIFMDYSNNKNFTDSNTFIYGHNMRNGSMFGKLKNFHDEATYESKPYIWIYTPDMDYKYQIVSYYVVDVEGDSFIHFYDTPEEFESYLDMVIGYSEYNTGVEVTSDDRIITLSTCTGDSSTRFLVHAKLIAIRDSTGYQKILD